MTLKTDMDRPRSFVRVHIRAHYHPDAHFSAAYFFYYANKEIFRNAFVFRVIKKKFFKNDETFEFPRFFRNILKVVPWLPDRICILVRYNARVMDDTTLHRR